MESSVLINTMSGHTVAQAPPAQRERYRQNTDGKCSTHYSYMYMLDSRLMLHDERGSDGYDTNEAMIDDNLLPLYRYYRYSMFV